MASSSDVTAAERMTSLKASILGSLCAGLVSLGLLIAALHN